MAPENTPAQVLAVPFHIGERVEGFPAPPGSIVLEPSLPAGTPQARMIALFRDLARRVASGGSPFVYAGDCMAPLGVLAGLQRRGIFPHVVWLDAHGDFNTWETTPSGYIGGMPIAMLAGRGEQTIVEGLGLEPIDERKILIADARDVDPGEGVALSGSGVRIAAVEDLAGLLPAAGPLYVHLDVDVVTPSEMPALRFPAEGGPSLARVEASVRALAATGRIVGTTVACTWDPAAPGAKRAAAAAGRLTAVLSGGAIPLEEP